MSNTSGEEIFRPYARLITILGDQLITNKIVAINEIVKNSYDANAEKVFVRFFNFKNYGKKGISENEKPMIEIEDDGDGMTIDIIKDIWLKPATPNKFNQKKSKSRFTKKGRLMQGEKGIGRFAIHKLGDSIAIYTKANNQKEALLELEFTEYDKGNQMDLFNTQKEIDSNYKFLDEIKNKWYVNSVPKKIKKANGTLIQVRNIRDNWTQSDLVTLKKSFSNLIPPSIPSEDRNKLNLNFDIVKDFSINILWNGVEFEDSGDSLTFESVCEEAPFKFIAEIDEQGVLHYNYISRLERTRKVTRDINLIVNDQPLTLYSISKRFYELNEDNQKVKTHDPKVGPFKFILYGFDLTNKAKWKNKKDELEFIKDNSVYLFRDGIRVYPYGNKEIDWLEISKKRAEYKAGDFFSYNDLVGFIFISHDENSKLKDATNREGLMDIDGAYEDFKALLIAAIQVMKFESDLDKGKNEKKNQKPLEVYKKNLASSFSSFSKKIEKITDKDIEDSARKYLDSASSYVKEMDRRTEIYEDLAGLGLAVEKASHDAFSLIQKMTSNIQEFKRKITKNEKISKKDMLLFLSDLQENTSYLYDQLQLTEPLFRISKRNESLVSVKDIINKLTRYFKLELDRYNIDFEIIMVKDIKFRTTIGMMLQLFINLMDNAIYWLVEKGGKRGNKILVKVDGNKNEIVFADNGVGIGEDIKDLIFMEFFSTKPKDRGRGLGLFIIKEILNKMDGTIELISIEKNKLLKGANFRILFPKVE